MTEQRQLPKLDGRDFFWIECHMTRFNLSRVNLVNVRCGDCKAEILPGFGLSRIAYRQNGYVCLDCFANTAKIANHKFGYTNKDSGFRINFFGNVESCIISQPDYSTQEVIDAVSAAILPIRIETAAAATL